MISVDVLLPLLSTLVALAAVVFTTMMMARQTRQIEHERNALALIEAIDRLSSPEVVAAFYELAGVNERYPTDIDLREKFPGSADERALFVVAQFIETIACLARREVLDASLIVDAVGLLLRTRWAMIQPFVERQRTLAGNPYIYENFDWLARYSAWWKDEPRPKRPNYDPAQFSV
ncbi:MAG TPA: DUF4760 domain-containing protein [Candidatus Eremiobacteraceae bacterium]|nr:DUF4760 domain-containing protein [Candidatus Eremiobacteraceae bacterium]